MNIRKIWVFGIVQGVGFRPFIKRLADDMGLYGNVCNRGAFVEIIVSAEDDRIEEFKKRIIGEAPASSIILKMEEYESDRVIPENFSIVGSKENKGERFIPADIGICDKCRAELYDKNSRRYLHPFINCTDCGPRLTVIKKLPYDREYTSMDSFEMCSECEEEYRDVSDRRFDAQPVCCNNCGPALYAYKPEDVSKIIYKDPITEARRVIADGGVVAVKGIGGFHLCCDATNPIAVSKLRQRKARPSKPFAVMAKNIEAIKEVCEVDSKAEALLCSPQKPIVILPKKSKTVGGNLLINKEDDLILKTDVPTEQCAPDNPTLGVFLPYAPIQLLLFDYPDDISDMPKFFVMTSGNVSGAPIATNDNEANDMLGKYCDLILSHNRDILCRADDSVISYHNGKELMIRRSRGYAPLPIEGPDTGECVIAIGGELKSVFCIARDEWYYPSSFIGEQTDIRSEIALRETIDHYINALSIKPDKIVCDMHPGYITSRIAKDIAREYNIGLEKVQHHYAHVLSCMAENHLDEKVLGVTLDGTGYGEDGGIWGGELLVCDRSSYERAASHAPFSQVGGDQAARDGWRIAVSMICDRFGDEPQKADEWSKKLGLCNEEEYEAIRFMYDKNTYRKNSTSCGRLFDAAAAVIGLKKENTFEGEAAMALQFAAQRYLENKGISSGEGYIDREHLKSTISYIDNNRDFSLREKDGRMIIPTDVLFDHIIREYIDGKEEDLIALDFHEILSILWKSAIIQASGETGIKKVVLSGGCFVNNVLSDHFKYLLEQEGLQVYTHGKIPPNDGGISLGQAYRSDK
ncbi:MAG: carbamoyltransferase HypF [Lachnospiraceae bacterium]|nr:carbamoyltransferase HypF [Lachnospiraceae bacterium]